LLRLILQNPIVLDSAAENVVVIDIIPDTVDGMRYRM
jgi:hypothetical protein